MCLWSLTVPPPVSSPLLSDLTSHNYSWPIPRSHARARACSPAHQAHARRSQINARSRLKHARSELKHARSGLKHARSGLKHARSGLKHARFGLKHARRSQINARSGLKHARRSQIRRSSYKMCFNSPVSLRLGVVLFTKQKVEISPLK